MEAYTARNSEDENETRALERLLDIFGSAVHLRDIASAFCKAGRNFELAAEILSESNGSSSSPVATNILNDEPKTALLSEQLSENISKARADMHSKASKPRKYSASVGTVSDVIGKGYSKCTTLSNGSSQTGKPVKVNLSEFPSSNVQGDEALVDSMTRKDPENNDIDEFLFKMLGEGFKLGMDVIHDVLGSCGYDANKSMEKLLDLSASTLNRSDDIVGGFAEKSLGKDSKQKHLLSETSRNPGLSQRDGTKLSREVLTSLFSAPERHVEPRKSLLVRAVKKTRSYGTVVSEPLIDRILRPMTDIGGPQNDPYDDVEEEDNYQFLRRVAKEHWVTMKEYYKDAVDAFEKGNQTLADELLEQGRFFNTKAREADERSSQKIFECSTKEIRDEVLLDLHDHDVNPAIRLLKLHLTNLASIGSFQNLKVILETGGEAITKASKGRRVLKLLERESIKWTEEGGAITIQLGDIDPDKLSFAKKSKETL